MSSLPPESQALFSQLEDALVADERDNVLAILKCLAGLGKVQRFADIAYLYESGSERLIPRLDLALVWYRKSAYEEIDATGYFGMGRFYFYGQGVARDVHQAELFFKEAYALGSTEAAIMLGALHYRGDARAPNLSEAKQYLQAAARLGYPAAFYFLHKIALKEHHYIDALKLWWSSLSRMRALTLNDPNSPKLFFLHGAWKVKPG